MKNKNITYLLLAVVGLVWGTIIYRFITTLSQENAPIENISYQKIKTPQSLVPDSFILFANYRDPFLGRQFATVNTYNPQTIRVKPIKNIKKPEVLPVKSIIDWSFIRFSGIIKNKNTGKEVALISINGKEQMAGLNSVLENVTILSFSKDSLHVFYQGEKKTIRK